MQTTLGGDRYPANETYLTDIKGNILFLGVSAPDAVHEFGPMTELLFTAFENMSRYNFNIIMNEDETFNGVLLNNGQYYSQEDWYNLFRSLDPRVQSTGTNVTNDGVETDY